MTAITDAPLTLHGALDALNERQFSTVELVRLILQRIEQTEPTLHAYVELYPEETLHEATLADQMRARGLAVPPLLGVPIGVKDIFDVAGKLTRCNSRLRANIPAATTDAIPVRAIRRDGAIVLGKTVTQEFAAGVVSAPTRNPWDPERIPGGSSGGSAAAVAAGSCLGALGSDTGGSIRIPASVTGTVGLKPTFGCLRTEGVFPLSVSLDTVGPIARTVLDATILFLSLADRGDEIAAQVKRMENAGDSLSGMRIGVLTSFFNERIQPDVAKAFNLSVQMLQRLGAEIVECTWVETRAARAAALLISRVESAAVHRVALREEPHLMGNDLRSRLEIGAILPGDIYLRARQVREAATRSMEALFQDHRLTAVVTPTLAATAPKADSLKVSFPDDVEESAASALTRFTTPWNATGQPVVSVPCGFDTDGLPIGLSFVGRPSGEIELCRMAHVFERTAGWYRSVPPI